MTNKTNIVTRLVISVSFAIVGGATTVAGEIIYVDGDAIGEYDGSSWAHGYRCLQDALAEARPGDEIQVAKGIYRPDRRTTGGGGRTGSAGAEITASGDRTATFELINGVTLKGGYAGYGEPYPDARDIDLYETILSGDLGANDVHVNNADDLLNESSRAENSFHVMTSRGGGVIDGFTITGGNANAYPDRDGGGLLNQYGTPQITNSTFSANSAEHHGGGMYNYRGNPSLTNCTFTGNSAEDNGGGICNYQSDPSLANCTFRENSARYGGGGIHNYQSNPSLANCTFIENSAPYGGGLYNYGGSPDLTNCALSANSAGDYGGGMYNTRNSNLTLRNCIFTANQAGVYGAGMSCNNSDPTLTNCTFSGNSAPDGSALAFNGGRSTVAIINCILWQSTNAMWNNDGSQITVLYSNIQDGWPGEGNIDADPIFADPDGPDNIPGTEDDDLGLAPISPCVDTGNPDYVPGPDETDLDGHPRIVSGRIDMGAYEFQLLIYVDDDAPDDPGPGDPELSDPREDGTKTRPMDTIQEAIDAADDGYTILVRPGVYERINFEGKAITVAGTEGAAVIQAPWEDQPPRVPRPDAVTFHTGEGPDSVLTNFVIRNSGMAISLNYESSPTIRNLTIVDNDFGIAAYENSNPDISNCILWNNTDGDLFQCEARYSCIEEGREGEGNISADPHFVDAANGDYHLLSERGRYVPAYGLWSFDDVTSPCIDAGDPTVDPSNERMPNGGRINMGAYGGTAEGSLGRTPRETTIAGDVNVDYKVDLADLAILGSQWLWRDPLVYPPPPPEPEPPRPKGRTCFPVETLVWVNGAPVQISNVVSGQMVGETHCDAAKPRSLQIERVDEHEGTFECRDIVLESGNRISVVDAHCFMLDSGRWIAAQNLTSGLRLKTLNGTVAIESVAVRTSPFIGKVYNLKVKGADRYLVGEDAVIVRDY